MSKQVVLYGIGGAEKAYAVLAYCTIFKQDNDIDEIREAAAKLRAKHPSIKRVFRIDDWRGLKREYQESIRLSSIESLTIFKHLLQRYWSEIKD